MSQNYDMLGDLVQDAIELIQNGGGINEIIDAIILSNDLTEGEGRSIIYFMAQRGYRYTNKGA